MYILAKNYQQIDAYHGKLNDEFLLLTSFYHTGDHANDDQYS